MDRPIVLWRRKATVSSDEACTTITTYALPRYVAGPYEAHSATRGRQRMQYVPSLKSLCIKQLVGFPEQLYTLGEISFPYEAPAFPGQPDILIELIPELSYLSGTQSKTFLEYVDPRLWAVVVQLYTGLPDVFRRYTLPLSDIHMPLLQQIQSTGRFALVTILVLRGCEDIDDQTISELREMHGLAALDVSETALGSWGVSKLSKTLVHGSSKYTNRRLNGPWPLRILRLKDCMNIDDEIYRSLLLFPLLSVVDLRGTRCTPSSYKTTPFRCQTNGRLYHPTPLHDSLIELSNLSSASSQHSSLFSHPEPFYLYVDSLHHKPAPTRRQPPPIIDILNSFRHRPSQHSVFVANEDTEHNFAIDDRNAIAGVEARRGWSKAAALSFYSNVSVRKDYRRFPEMPLDRHGIRTGEQLRSLAGLTLFRPPPPWQTLEDIANEVDGSHKREKPKSTTKRPRIEIDEALMDASDAKRKGHARKAVQAIWGMVERRKSAPESQSSSQLEVVEMSRNPFLRKMGRSIFDEVEQVSTGHAASFTSTATKSGTEYADKDDLEAIQKSIIPLPPPTTKPLRPISALSVPVRPEEALKTLSRSKSSDSIKKASVSSDGARQMKISVFAEEATRKAHATPSIHGSFKAAEATFIVSNTPDTRAEHNSSSDKTTGRVAHGKRKKSQKSFDWKAWGSR